MITLTVTKEQGGQELYDLLDQLYPDFTPRDQDLALKVGDILLNGKVPFGGDTVKSGDIVEMFLAGDVVGADMTPRIIYQDENFVVADKPAGLLSFSDDGEPNAVDMIEEMMKQQGEYSLGALMVPYLVYPLEQYVSGILVMAKHEEGYLFLVEALNQRRLSRDFVCAVKGAAHKDDELMAYHSKDKAGRRARIHDRFQKDAKPIVTRYEALAAGETMSLLRVRPVTNLLHQVRAHLAHAQLPVLGDEMYGDKRFSRRAGADHICLWVQTLVFETGTRHEYAYMNGRKFESSTSSFPRSVYDEGLMEL